MSKILFISNISHKITSFAISSIYAAQALGIEFVHASNWQMAEEGQIEADEAQYNIRINSVQISRNPLSVSNLKAYKELVELIQQEHIDFIHCNTPTGGLLGRLAGKVCNVKRVIYQAHGFHFYKGAPMKNWLIYYPIERWLARYTDALITINQEDYELARKKFKLRNGGKVYYVPGVGIDTVQYNTEKASRVAKRNELGLEDEDIAVISMGDLIERKNYDVSIRAIAEAANPRLHYFVCGNGPEEEKLKHLAERLNISEKIHFLGFRSDVKELLAASDVFLFTTKQEGLPRSMMEAMASGLPCIVSKIRGNTDLLEEAKGGYLCDTNDVSAYAEKLNILCSDTELRMKMSRHNLMTVQKFSVGTVTDEIHTVYRTEFQQSGN